jgi:hypothetical protein
LPQKPNLIGLSKIATLPYSASSMQMLMVVFTKEIAAQIVPKNAHYPFFTRSLALLCYLTANNICSVAMATS